MIELSVMVQLRNDGIKKIKILVTPLKKNTIFKRSETLKCKKKKDISKLGVRSEKSRMASKCEKQ